MRAVWVRVHFKPAELKSRTIHDRLSNYGTILFSRENRILGTEILSGSLTFKMKLSEQIPSFIYIGPICLAVNYDGQLPTCRKCDSTEHIARMCQIKRCFNCGRSGHLNHLCPKPVKCQGCSSTDHCFEQCPSCWESEEPDNTTQLGQDAENGWNWGDQAEQESQNATEPPETDCADMESTGGNRIIDESRDSDSHDILPDGQPMDTEPLGELPSGLKRPRGAY